MPHKLRKHRKMRGSRTQGYGRVGQHRDAGSKGYRKVGMHKHRWSITSNMEESYFGKHGFRSPQALHKKEKTINLKQLDQLVNNGQTTVNLSEMGYTKLLGAGKITRPLTIKVSSASKSATEKIQAAGGKLLIETNQQTEAE